MLSRRGIIGAGAGFGLSALESTHGLLAERVRHLETLEHEDTTGGWPILGVAASDASAQAKADADWVCDGVNDEVEIQAALDANHATTEGVVYLTEGNFYVHDTIHMYQGSQLWGSGRSTVLRVPAAREDNSYDLLANAGALAQETGLTIQGIYFFGRYGDGRQRAISLDSVTQSLIFNCHFRAISGAPIRLDGICWNNRILSNVFYQTSHENDHGDYTIDLVANTVENTYITNNGLYQCNTGGIRLRGVYSVVVGNGIWECGAWIGAGVSVESDGNQVQSNYVIEGYTDGIAVDGSTGYGLYEANRVWAALIQGNQVYNSYGHGIRLKQADECNVQANIVSFASQHGIYLDNSHRNVLVGNHSLYNGSAVNLTYDNIIVDANSDDNTVQANHCKRTAAGNQTRYGLNMANANCNTNMVTNNDLRNSGWTGSLNDVGTGTVTAAGNRV